MPYKFNKNAITRLLRRSGAAPFFLCALLSGSASARSPVLTQSGATLTASTNAQFIEQNVSTTMIAGQHYTAIVKMQNNGSTAWTSGSTFYLGSRNPTDNTTWGTGRVALNSNVAPGQSYVFSFDVTAPDPGMYSFQWQMVQPGTAGFGASTPNVSITVSPPHPSIAWTGLNDALSRADKTAVLNYFADSSKYDAIFTAMGDNMKLLASSMSGFAFIEIASNHASAVVNQTEPSGTVFQHYVTFIYKDRRWQIIDF